MSQPSHNTPPVTAKGGDSPLWEGAKAKLPQLKKTVNWSLSISLDFSKTGLPVISRGPYFLRLHKKVSKELSLGEVRTFDRFYKVSVR